MSCNHVFPPCLQVQMKITGLRYAAKLPIVEIKTALKGRAQSAVNASFSLPKHSSLPAETCRARGRASLQVAVGSGAVQRADIYRPAPSAAFRSASSSSESVSKRWSAAVAAATEAAASGTASCASVRRAARAST